MYQDFSAIYEEKIKEDFDYQAMADFILGQMRQFHVKGKYALDMGCGTGNAGLMILPSLERMILCDPSEEMLTLARNKYSGSGQATFLKGEAPTFLYPDRFDLIISVLDIPNYLDSLELEAFLHNSYRNLEHTGILIFDISSVHKLTKAAMTGVFVYDDEDYFHVWENQLVGKTLELTINAFIRTRGKSAGRYDPPLYHRVTEEQVMHLHTEEEIDETAQNAGFMIAGKYDGYTEKPAFPGSERIVYVLTKGVTING